jgi:hypothetical protein
MLSWVAGVVGTFALSLLLACWFLRLRCRKIGPPFGPRARVWAIVIMVGTAVISTGVGLLIVAASRDAHDAFAGLVVPFGLGFSRLPPSELVPRTLAGRLSLPFSRLYDRMGDDLQAWCDTRLTAACVQAQWTADAAKYYLDQVSASLAPGSQDRKHLQTWHDSIQHKITVVRLIGLDTTPARLGDQLARHESTRDIGPCTDEELAILAERLRCDAENELSLFLAYLYRLGHHKLLIYPFRPSVHRDPLRRPETTAGGNT